LGQGRSGESGFLGFAQCVEVNFLGFTVAAFAVQAIGILHTLLPIGLAAECEAGAKYQQV